MEPKIKPQARPRFFFFFENVSKTTFPIGWSSIASYIITIILIICPGQRVYNYYWTIVARYYLIRQFIAPALEGHRSFSAEQNRPPRAISGS